MSILQIGNTAKGSRIWLQGLERYGWPAGTPYTVTWEPDRIVLEREPTSKRKVTAGKGGVIDITSRKVTTWAGDATHVVALTDDAHTNGLIVIERSYV